MIHPGNPLVAHAIGGNPPFGRQSNPTALFQLEQQRTGGHVFELAFGIAPSPELAEQAGQDILTRLVTWRHGTNLALSILNNNFVESDRFTTSRKLHTLKSAASLWMPLKVADLDGDKRRDLLVYVFTGYEQKPRGLYAYNMQEKKVLWSFEAGPALLDFSSLDLNGDGHDDVLFGSNAVGNANHEEENRTDDSNSYLFALSHKGERLWIRRLGDSFTQAHVVLANLDNDDKNDIVAWVHYGWERRNVPELAKDWEHGEIIRLDYEGRITARFSTNHQIMSCASADLDHDGREEILATDRLGTPMGSLMCGGRMNRQSSFWMTSCGCSAATSLRKPGRVLARLFRRCGGYGRRHDARDPCLLGSSSGVAICVAATLPLVVIAVSVGKTEK